MDTGEILKSLQQWLRAGNVGELAVNSRGGEVSPCDGFSLGVEPSSYSLPAESDAGIPDLPAIPALKPDAKVMGASDPIGFAAVRKVL
jgi:hypothetical protein